MYHSCGMPLCGAGVCARRVEAAMVHKAPLKIYARGVVSYFYFSARRARVRAENKANQQYHFKSSQCCMDPLGTDSCHRTVPMEPLMPNGSMQHQEPKSEIDDTRIIVQGGFLYHSNRCVAAGAPASERQGRFGRV